MPTVCRVVALVLLMLTRVSGAAEYQWSALVPPAPTTMPTTTVASADAPRAYLWIPPTCRRVRAVVLAEHNMLEEDLLDDARFRAALGELGIAEVWISPSADARLDDPAAFLARIDATMRALADASGYDELAAAPLAPIGHSAHASMPWNLAAFAPARTLCALSVHGDAPATPIAGYGRAAPTWGQRPDALDGVPGLMVMGEYEWIEARLAPLTVFRFTHPRAPIAMLAEPGGGHFAADDGLVPYLAMFLRKCVEQRLAADGTLRPIDPAKGWLVQRWTPRVGRTVEPAPFDAYRGDAVDASWAFDEEMARATHDYHADRVGRRPQLVDFAVDGRAAPFASTHAMVTLAFAPDADGETFRLATTFLDAVPSLGDDPSKDGPGKNNCVRWTGLPAGSALGHAGGGGAIAVRRIEGPCEQVGPDTFRLAFYRGYSARQQMWFAATHPGDAEFTSAVQQAAIDVPRNDVGAAQTIAFAPIDDARVGDAPIPLRATASAGLPVHFYVREGPAEVNGDALTLLPLPARARLPVTVTVVAWQWGRGVEPRVRRAPFVERAFQLRAAP